MRVTAPTGGGDALENNRALEDLELLHVAHARRDLPAGATYEVCPVSRTR